LNTALVDLIFWIALFVALFFLLRWLQARNKTNSKTKDE
jgi:hypothetical protein